MPTIRSRTQHLEFRLIGGDTLSSLLHDVQGAAGLAADDALIDAAVRLGRGSARDALSALDQLIATGSISETQPQFDGLFEALVDLDAVKALRSLALLTREGWDPEQLAESFGAEVRQVFLLQVAPEVADAVDVDRERLGDWGLKLGLPRTVRILETFGLAMREMKSAPEKVVVLEVALVRLIRPELDSSIESLDERLTKLERDGVRVATPAPTAPAPVLRPIGSTVATPPSTQATTPATTTSTTSPEPTVAPAKPSSTEPPSSGGEGSLDLEDVRERFEKRVVPRTPRSAQLLLKNAQVRSLEGHRITISLPTEEMRRNTEYIAPGLRSAMDHEFKVTLHIEWVVDVNQAPTSAPTRITTQVVEEATNDDLEAEESGVVVDSVAGHLISEMFPGAEEIS
jgi:DNA polymerase III gamma/tau subunit